MRKTACSLFLSLIAAIAFPGGGALAGTIRTQLPCPADSAGVCFTFHPGAPFFHTIRAFTFNVPAGGPKLAEVTFHGSLYCGETGSNTTTYNIYSFATQILTAPTQIPQVQGPGAMRLAALTAMAPEPLAYS
jgi:hypothetical protein